MWYRAIYVSHASERGWSRRTAVSRPSAETKLFVVETHKPLAKRTTLESRVRVQCEQGGCFLSLRRLGGFSFKSARRAASTAVAASSRAPRGIHAFVAMSLAAGDKRPAASPAEEDTSARHVVPRGPGGGSGPGSSAFTVKRLTIPTEASPGQMLLESPLLLPGLLVRFPACPTRREGGGALFQVSHDGC